ncbi:MAG: 4Fe-4S binding protein [Nanoarchaeota archaeon]|nr:4Fe-4S binding protein [Nanoarchaeota archaeon]MBU1134913.1 4Fe-4S binding protein [Nanoarchaeota archaeon]MBU2520256.1 4Fe-4S binding protein [Nanoarchaeota archaeon]
MPKPIIDYSKCTHCKTCVEVCPVEVFAKEADKVVVKKPDKCINCKSCEAQCPSEAIKVMDE